MSDLGSQTIDTTSPQEGRGYNIVLTDRSHSAPIRAMYRRGYFYALDASGNETAPPGSYPFARAIHPSRVRIIADEATPQSPEAEAWQALVQAAHRWASEHMDQWEQVKFETKFGTVYLTLSHKTDWPDAFDKVDSDGRPASPEALADG